MGTIKDTIFEGIKGYVRHNILSKNPDPEYYNHEVRQLKVKVRKMYKKINFGQTYQADLKRLSKELLVAKKKAQQKFLRSGFQNEGGGWRDFYKYVKRRKGNRENIPANSEHNGKHFTVPIAKAILLNSYYASVISCESKIRSFSHQIQVNLSP